MRKNIAMGKPQREGLDTPRPGTAPEPQPVGRYEAKQLTAATAANSRLTRHASLQLRPRPLPEILVAANALKVNLICHSQLLWLVDSVLGCDYLPVAWTKVEKRMWGSMEHGSKEMNKLTSTERLRFASHGDVPRYSNTLIRLTSELNPMASAVKDTTDILI